MQVRAMVDLLPAITVVADDPFNSSPTDPKLMGPDALQRFSSGEQLPAMQVPTPLVHSPSLTRLSPWCPRSHSYSRKDPWSQGQTLLDYALCQEVPCKSQILLLLPLSLMCLSLRWSSNSGTHSLRFAQGHHQGPCWTLPCVSKCRARPQAAGVHPFSLTSR